MTSSDSTSTSTENTAQAPSGEASVTQATGDARDRLEQHYRDIEQTYGDTRARIENINERAVDFIRDNPGVCIAGALAAGYLVGRLASRRWLS